MKVVIAYALLIIGIPNYVGLLIGGLIRVPLAWAAPYGARSRVLNVSGVFCGLASIASALLLFWLEVHAGLAVVALSTAWVSFYFLVYHQSRLEWLCYVGGIVIGWLFLRDYIQT
jgi:hypothetical protein